MKCEHDDCFTCPYDDCILPDVKLDGKDQAAYQKRRAENKARSLKYYYEHKEERRKYQAEYGKRDYVRQKRRAYDEKYRETHREELNAKARERYYARKAKQQKGV